MKDWTKFSHNWQGLTTNPWRNALNNSLQSFYGYDVLFIVHFNDKLMMTLCMLLVSCIVVIDYMYITY
jgi:hypothetical protein